jgi:hypothetical protein
MKRIIAVLLAALGCGFAVGQNPNPGIVAVTSLPSSCTGTLPVWGLMSGNSITLYQCQSGVPTAAGGSGTFNALTGDATSTATGGTTTVKGLNGVPFCTGFTPTNGQSIQYTTASSPNPCYTAATGGGSGTVTSFSAGTLSPLFSTSVATSTTTPALTFSLSNAAQNSIFGGPITGGTGAPSFLTAPAVLQEQTQVIQADNYTSPDLAFNAAVTQAQSSGLSQVVRFSPNKSYNLAVAVDLTTTNRTCIDIEGGGIGALPGGNTATIHWTGAASATALKHTSTHTTLGCYIHDISIDGGDSAAIAFDNEGQSAFRYDHVSFTDFNNPTGPVLIRGNPSGGDYQQIGYDIQVTELGTINYATCVTPLFSGGTFAANPCTSIGNSGGGPYKHALAVPVGCTTQPTITVTMSGSTVASLASTGGVCPNTSQIYITDVSSKYGIADYSGDGTCIDCVVNEVGRTAGILAAGFTRWYHPHVYIGQPLCIEDHGGNYYDDVEADSCLQFDMSFLGFTSVVNSGQTTFNNTDLPGVTGKSIFDFTTTSSGQNQISNWAINGPTNFIANPYAVNGTFYAEHNSAGLPTGDNFCLLSASGSGSLQNPECYGTNTFSGLTTFSAGINLSGSTSPLEVGGSAGSSGQVLTSAGAGATPTWTAVSGGGNTTSTSLATGFLPKANGTNSIINSGCDEGVTTANVFTCSDTAGASFKSLTTTGTGVASQVNLTPSGTSPATVSGAASLGVPNTVTTPGVYLLPAAPATGIWHASNASGIVTDTLSAVSLTADVSGILPVANGGSGTSSPALVAGTNVTITGSWPNQTINSSGGGGTTTNALTMNNSGSGAASGTTFNGSAALTISYNTIGAQQALTLTTTGTSGAATLTSGTLNIPQYSSGGGLPTSTNAQTYYSATTTGTATSAILVDSASTTGAIQIGGVYSHFGAGPTSSTTTTATLAAAGTSVTLTSSTGYPTCSTQTPCYVVLGSNNFVGEIAAASSITGNVLTLSARSLFGTTAATTLASGSSVDLISDLHADSTSVTPYMMKIWGGATYFYPNSGNLQAGSALQGVSGLFAAIPLQAGGGVSFPGSGSLFGFSTGVGIKNSGTGTIATFDADGILGLSEANLAVTAIQTTIAPVTGVVNLTGVAPTALATITVPTPGSAAGSCGTTGISCEIRFLGVGFVTVTSGNIGNVITVAANVPAYCTYLLSATKWYCK